MPNRYEATEIPNAAEVQAERFDWSRAIYGVNAGVITKREEITVYLDAWEELNTKLAEAEIKAKMYDALIAGGIENWEHYEDVVADARPDSYYNP